MSWDAYCGIVETLVLVLLSVWFYLDRRDKGEK
jgi:hypothetical protein